MNIDLDKLKHAAEAVAMTWEGKYLWKALPLNDRLQRFAIIADEPCLAKGQIATEVRSLHTASFMAQVSPVAILELIERVERAESDLAFQKQVTDAARQTQAEMLARAEWAEAGSFGGYIIEHADGTRWRTLDSIGLTGWTDDRMKALCLSLREHADAFAGEDPADVRIVTVLRSRRTGA